VIAEDLATQADALQAALGEHLLFRLGHLFRFPGDKLHAAGGTAGISPAGMQLVYAGLINQSED
jgi:hypothetical protein